MVANKKKDSDIQKRKTEMLSKIYYILSMTLGEPIKEFNYAFTNKEGKTVTPTKSIHHKVSIKKQLESSLMARLLW